MGDDEQQGGRSFRERKKDKTEGATGREARNSKPAWKQQGGKAETISQSLARVRMKGTRELREGTKTEAKRRHRSREYLRQS